MISQGRDLLQRFNNLVWPYIFTHSTLFKPADHLLLKNTRNGDTNSIVELASRHLNKSHITIEQLPWALHIFLLNKEDSLSHTMKNTLLKNYPDIMDHIIEIKKIFDSTNSFDYTHDTLECYSRIYDFYHTISNLTDQSSKIQADFREQFIEVLLSVLKKDTDYFQLSKIKYPSDYETSQQSLINYYKDCAKYQIGFYHTLSKQLNEKYTAFITAGIHGNKNIHHDAALILTSFIIEDAKLPHTYAHFLTTHCSDKYANLIDQFNIELKKVPAPNIINSQTKVAQP
ncbi:MAG: hypothetical protein A3F11_06695 [Gammaproteobacteria bacterium RIFCSPHIGHO2_12_FULL_37_14]|nr:MAG: hypothetical protein A3F11_06695 [Gammaproteobacteria bacterium RIFCSPHIGHO2_12_FULL_37_14]